MGFSLLCPSQKVLVATLSPRRAPLGVSLEKPSPLNGRHDEEEAHIKKATVGLISLARLIPWPRRVVMVGVMLLFSAFIAVL